MRIYLIRHPQPDIAPGICYGRTDVGVAAAEQARILGDLVSALPTHIPVFSSPARRCSALAASLAHALESDAPVHDPRLAEMYFGAWEMRAWDEIPRAEVEAWNSDLAHYRPGGGESVLQVAQRVSAFHDELLALPHPAAAVVCHAGTIRLLTACRPGLPPLELALLAAGKPHRIAYGELLAMER
jgi:alpha-ribazole phosphatase